MVIDYSITIGNIIEIGSIIGGGILVLITLKSDVTALKAGAESVQTEIKEMQAEIKQIGQVLITQADQNRRLLHVEEEIRDLRRGRGFIRSTPLSGSGLDGEYP